MLIAWSRRQVAGSLLCLALIATLAAPGVVVRRPRRSAPIRSRRRRAQASSTTNHHTEVEPDTFSNGSTIVAAFQVGRIFDGGACAIGFATSTNNGATLDQRPAARASPNGRVAGPTTAPPTRQSPMTPQHNVVADLVADAARGRRRARQRGCHQPLDRRRSDLEQPVHHRHRGRPR